MKKPIRVMITDDHPIYRQAAAAALQCQENIVVVGFCSSGPEAIEKVPEYQPDIVLMDIRMQPMDGIETTTRIKELYPDLKVIGFSLETRPEVATRMLKAGASGYVTKSSPRIEICEAITHVLNGKQYICREVKEGKG
jgi:two-component system, NarL family, response regulator LiaR